MTRTDLIALEQALAAAYRREASRRHKNPELQAQLQRRADEAEKWIESLRCGPIFELMRIEPKRRAA